MKTGLMLLLWVWAFSVRGEEVSEMRFRDAAQEQQFYQLTTQLRCPQCQNSSIADSSAPVARDMRLKVWVLMMEGKTPQEIVDYMVARYGYFVTWDPPLTPLVVLLWVLPAGAVLAGAGIIVWRTRGRRQQQGGAEPRADTSPPLPGWLLLPGVGLALAVSVGSYMRTGNLSQVRALQQTKAEMPQLLAQVLDKTASVTDSYTLTRLALGLRARLQDDACHTGGWLMLGRISQALGNAQAQVDANARAWALAPDDPQVARAYITALLASDRDNEQARGQALCEQWARTQQTTLHIGCQP